MRKLSEEEVLDEVNQTLGTTTWLRQYLDKREIEIRNSERRKLHEFLDNPTYRRWFAHEDVIEDIKRKFPIEGE